MNMKVMQALYGGGNNGQMRGRDSRGRYMGGYGAEDNMIGFGAQDTYHGRGDGMGGNSVDTYGRGGATLKMVAGGQHAHQKMEAGVADIEEYIEKPLTIGEAMKWAEGLPEGAKWQPEEVKQYATKAGVATSGRDFAEFYAVMNAMHSDFHQVLSKHGVTDPAVYAEMACAFINDEDSVENKSAVYYRFIVDDD